MVGNTLKITTPGKKSYAFIHQTTHWINICIWVITIINWNHVIKCKLWIFSSAIKPNIYLSDRSPNTIEPSITPTINNASPADFIYARLHTIFHYIKIKNHEKKNTEKKLREIPQNMRCFHTCCGRKCIRYIFELPHRPISNNSNKRAWIRPREKRHLKRPAGVKNSHWRIRRAICSCKRAINRRLWSLKIKLITDSPLLLLKTHSLVCGRHKGLPADIAGNICVFDIWKSQQQSRIVKILKK